MKSTSQHEPAAQAYASFILNEARSRLGRVVIPATLRDWDEHLKRVRAGLTHSFGRMPEVPCPLDPDVLGTLERDGYAIERLTFQSRPGVRVTANLYRPEPVREHLPAVLSVHGHWSWARMDPHVQSRCIGLAKLGYVVLCVDAFGAGERAIEPGPGTYHGALVGASLWPVGTPLLGLQVYDNRRAVDYLISRPEVDSDKLAVTGASGGGNQTLYAGATDERLCAVIPVCGIGTYESYLTTACCVCEVNAGGATYATTGDLLAMIAPRALLVISATRDAFQFSVGEAAKSVAHARERFRLMGHEAKIRHTAIESGHDYNQPMREAMYGWLEKWLRGRGDGAPIREPDLKLEEVDALRCFAGGRPRPSSIVTIPEWAHREGMARLAALPKAPDHVEQWNADAERMRAVLRDQILGGFPKRMPLQVQRAGNHERAFVSIMTERDVSSRGALVIKSHGKGTALVVSSGEEQRPGDNSAERGANDEVLTWSNAGFSTLQSTCRDLPKLAPISGVLDHTVAGWGLWTGRPLLGQWVWDIIRWLDFLDESRSDRRRPGFDETAPARPFVLIGLGTMSLPALLAAALDPRVSGVACAGGLVSFVGATTRPWSGVAMGLIAPNILNVGDIGHLAALIAPRPLVYTGALEPEGRVATPDRTLASFAFSRSVYGLVGAEDRLKLSQPADLRTLLRPT
jgi:dienelactone hydrolase